MRQSLSYFLVVSAILVSLFSATWADERIGAFRVLDDHPDIIVLDGEIGINSPLEFRRAVAARPQASLVVLNSPGGLVASGLILANDIHDRGLSTSIPKGAGCYSACAFMFFAGVERLVEGELGVHQMYGTDDTSGVQARVSDIIEALEQFGGGFVVRVLRHQFAAESLGQQRGGQPVNGGLCLVETGFEAVGEGEEGFDSADDFLLLLYGRNRKLKCSTL